MRLSLIFNLLRTAVFGALALAAFEAIGGAPPAEGLRAQPHRDTAGWIEREAYLMGTLLRATVLAPDRTDWSPLDAALAEVRRLDDVLSTWRPDAELARVNAAPLGAPVALSHELADVLAEVWEWAGATQYAFDPGVGALVDVWDLRGSGRRPEAGELERALSASGLDQFQLDVAARTLARGNEASWLDSGGFGKGAALRAARRELERRGIAHALLSFGGQVLAMGGADPRGWLVWVAHPARRDQPVVALRLRDHSASTTSQSERYIEAAGERFGHVLDPRTGLPVPAWGSVTVVHRDPLLADILSTALFVLGPERGLAWAEGRGDVGALFLVERAGQLEARWTAAMTPFLERN